MKTIFWGPRLTSSFEYVLAPASPLILSVFLTVVPSQAQPPNSRVAELWWVNKTEGGIYKPPMRPFWRLADLKKRTPVKTNGPNKSFSIRSRTLPTIPPHRDRILPLGSILIRPRFLLSLQARSLSTSKIRSPLKLLEARSSTL